MKVLSLAVDGLERAHAEGLLTWAFQQDADVICFQDTRCSEYSLPSNDFFPENYHAYFADNYDDAKVNGVAVYCKKMPKAIMFGLGFMDFDHLGIYIQADYDDCSIGSIMVPPAVGERGDKELKMRFLQQLGAHLQKVRNKKRDFILCGGGSLPGSRAMQKSREIASTFRDLVTKSATGLDRSIAWVIATHSVKWKRMQTITLGGQTATTAPACEPIPISFQTASRPTSHRPLSRVKRRSPAMPQSRSTMTLRCKASLAAL